MVSVVSRRLADIQVQKYNITYQSQNDLGEKSRQKRRYTFLWGLFLSNLTYSLDGHPALYPSEVQLGRLGP